MYSDSEILGGGPCFNGTRVPLESVLEDLGAGYSIEEILNDLPTIKEEHVRAVQRWELLLARKATGLSSPKGQTRWPFGDDKSAGRWGATFAAVFWIVDWILDCGRHPEQLQNNDLLLAKVVALILLSVGAYYLTPRLWRLLNRSR